MFERQVVRAGDVPVFLSPKGVMSLGMLFGMVLIGLVGCGGSAGPKEPKAPTPSPSGGSAVVAPVTAPGLTVTANENFAGGDFVDIDKYNQAVENYNNAGSALSGGNP